MKKFIIPFTLLLSLTASAHYRPCPACPVCPTPAPTPKPTPVPTPQPASCRVGNPLAAKSIHRGMYVSLINHSGAILGNTASENELLSFAINHGFDSMSFYDLNTVLTNGTSPQLSKFIQAAKGCGVVEVNAIGSVAREFDLVKSYQNSFPGKFDGLVTEVEYWNGSQVGTAFNNLISLLQYMKNLGIKNSAGNSLRRTTYIGWLGRNPNMSAAQEAQVLSQNVDRMFVHCYVKSASTAYSYCQSRMNDFKTTGVEVYPIFSAEGVGSSAGADTFMGNWLAANSIEAAEKIFNGQALSIQPGFQYFEYSYLKFFVK